MIFNSEVLQAHYTPAKLNCPVEDSYPSEFDYDYKIEPLDIGSYVVGEEIMLEFDGHEIEVTEGATLAFYENKLVLEVDSVLEETIAELIREHYSIG